MDTVFGRSFLFSVKIRRDRDDEKTSSFGCVSLSMYCLMITGLSSFFNEGEGLLSEYQSLGMAEASRIKWRKKQC